MAAALLYFDISTLPDAIQVTDAHLRLYATGREGASLMVTGVYPVLRSWSAARRPGTWRPRRSWEEAGCAGEGVDRDGTSVHNTMILTDGRGTTLT